VDAAALFPEGRGKGPLFSKQEKESSFSPLLFFPPKLQQKILSPLRRARIEKERVCPLFPDILRVLVGEVSVRSSFVFPFFSLLSSRKVFEVRMFLSQSSVNLDAHPFLLLVFVRLKSQCLLHFLFRRVHRLCWIPFFLSLYWHI